MTKLTVTPVLISDIEIDENNVRKTAVNDGIDDLAASIDRYGLLQPIVLRGEFGVSKPYTVIVGQRRFLAHKKLGKTEIEAVFINNLNSIDSIILSLSENIQRVELNYADKARYITELFDYFNKDIKKVAESLSISESSVRQYLTLEATATEKAKDLLRQDKISQADVKKVVKAAQGDPEKADQLIDSISKLTTSQKVSLLETAKDKPDATSDELIAEARKPKYSETVIVHLPFDLIEAIDRAKENLNLDSNDVILTALTHWLSVNNNFLGNE